MCLVFFTRNDAHVNLHACMCLVVLRSFKKGEAVCIYMSVCVCVPRKLRKSVMDVTGNGFMLCKCTRTVSVCVCVCALPVMLY